MSQLRQPSDAERHRDVRRIERQLARLQALLDSHRARDTALRIARGGLGFAATLAAAVKFKLAASLGAKLVLAAVVGLALAWPLAALAVVVVAVFVLSLLDGTFSSSDCSCECGGGRARRERLEALIATRESWLAGPTWPAPAIRAAPRARR